MSRPRRTRRWSRRPRASRVRRLTPKRLPSISLAMKQHSSTAPRAVSFVGRGRSERALVSSWMIDPEAGTSLHNEEGSAALVREELQLQTPR
jgi:hypothetical protein